MTMKLGFIGVGKIASAVVKGLCTLEIENTIINLSPRNESNSDHLVQTFSNVNKLESNQLVLDHSEVVFISLRPNDSKDVLNNLKFKDNHTVISFVPYLRYSELFKVVAPANKISRAIPLPTVVNHNCPIPIFNSNETVKKVLSYLGKPLLIEDENQLHALWTLTGFIAPFYDLLKELSDWATSKGANETIANQYIADMFYSLLFSNQKAKNIDFSELMKEATTPNGMNEQAGKEIKERGAHLAYRIAADNLLKRFG